MNCGRCATGKESVKEFVGVCPMYSKHEIIGAKAECKNFTDMELLQDYQRNVPKYAK
jgi:hypothetical protein